MKGPRIYAELAAVARENGYDEVTEWVVKDWRDHAMLPSFRGLGRSRRQAGRVPAAAKARLLAICRYRYGMSIRDLRSITLLLWLDGEDIPLTAVRTALGALTRLPERLVAQVGGRAKAADPEDPDADLDAAAGTVTGMDLPQVVGGTAGSRQELHASTYDALQLALSRDPSIENEALLPLALAIGLGRAHAEQIGGEGPWLAASPEEALAETLRGLFGPGSRSQIEAASDADLLRARDVSRRLHRVFEAFGDLMRLGFPKGAGGFGFLSLVARDPTLLRVLTLLVAVLQPSSAQTLAEGVAEETVAEMLDTVEAGEAWLAAHPELAEQAASRGLAAVAQDYIARKDTESG